MEAFYFFLEAIPVFENLRRLTIATERGFCWRTLPYLIKKSPNLKILIIQGPLHHNYHPHDDDDELDYDDELNYDDGVDELDYDGVSVGDLMYDYEEPICECLSGYSFLESDN